MKHFEMAAINQDDNIAALTRTNEELRTSNEELRTSNEELRTEHRELEAKYEILVGTYNRLKEEKDMAGSGVPGGAQGARDAGTDRRTEDPSRRRSYNVREYKGYPRSEPPPAEE